MSLHGSEVGGEPDGLPEAHKIPAETSDVKMEALITSPAETRNDHGSTGVEDVSSPEAYNVPISRSRLRALGLVAGASTLVGALSVTWLLGSGESRSGEPRVERTNATVVFAEEPDPIETPEIRPTRGPIAEKPWHRIIESHPELSGEKVAAAFSDNLTWAANHPEDTDKVLEQTIHKWGDPLGYEHSQHLMRLISNRAAFIKDNSPQAYYTVRFQWDGKPKRNNFGGNQYYGAGWIITQCTDPAQAEPLQDAYAYRFTDALIDEFERPNEKGELKAVLQIAQIDITPNSAEKWPRPLS